MNMTVDDIYKNDFAVFILTHGRPHNVLTYRTLRSTYYTGRIFIVIDDQDSTRDEYFKKYKDEVVVFSKKEIAKTFDQADNFTDMRTIVYARNACFDIAQQLGIKYFVQLDDDYTSFDFRFDNHFNYCHRKMFISLDKVFKSILKFFINTPISSISLAQGGDYIGGEGSGICFGQGIVGLPRKCMNSFFCSTDRRFNFVGRINEDVNTYTKMGSIGLLMFTTNQVCLNQMQTQSNKSGMTDVYCDFGTYLKSFYSVIFQPSSVKIKTMGFKSRRLHHSIDWDKTVPCIIDEKYKKY